MPQANVLLHAFNRGLISQDALARMEIERTPLSAEVFINYVPRVLGSAMLRPGLKYLGSTDSDNQAFFIPFVKSIDDTALLEFTDSTLRVWDGDSLVSRPSVTASITNGAFTSDLTGWTDADDTGGTSAWETGGYMSLNGDGTDSGRRRQQVTLNESGTQHALRIVIERGEVTLKVGSTAGDDDYIASVSLGKGTHSLTFTPTTDFHIEFSSYTKHKVLVDSVAVESSGTMSLPSPYATADLRLIRHDLSGDIIYIACEGYQQRKVERRANNSWSVVVYEPVDGPYGLINVSPTTLSVDSTTGDATLTASTPTFSSDHVGALFRITNDAQKQEKSISSANDFTDSIEVVERGGQRGFSLILTGTWSATVTLQYSVGVEGNWVDYDSYSTNQSITVNDGLDNQIVYYRIGIKSGDYTSGTVTATLSHSSGAQTGDVRINSVTSSTEAEVSILKDLGSTDATDDWYEGLWSTFRGFPSAVRFFQGRLWWAGYNRIIGSQSDDYEGFDNFAEGDAGVINRTIGFGPVETINWLAARNALSMGTALSEISARSDNFDAPLTPTNFNLTEPGTQGSAKVSAVKIDKALLFLQSSKTRVFELLYNSDVGELTSRDVTVHAPEVGEPEILRMVVQRQPDTRMHCVRSDGKVALLLWDKVEEILCWMVVETDGDIEDVVVLPGTVEDNVYYVVKRTIDGNTVRYLEKWALESDAIGAVYEYSGASTTSLTDLPYPNGITVTVYDSDDNKVENLVVSDKAVTLSSASTYAKLVPSVHLLADSFIEYDGASASTITGLDHLEGETVVARGDGLDLGTYTVASGQITLSTAVENAVIGLGYDAKFKSTKLAYAATGGTAVAQNKVLNSLGLIMNNAHVTGVQYGPDFNNLGNLPRVRNGKTYGTDHIFDHYDFGMNEFLKRYGPDARLCLKSSAPNPCTLLGVVMEIQTNG